MTHPRATPPGAWRRAYHAIDQALSAATKKRGNHSEIIELHGKLILAWEAYEWEVVRIAVNTIRSEHGLPPLEDTEEIYTADVYSAGHADWFSQFVGQCANLAIGRPLIKPPAMNI